MDKLWAPWRIEYIRAPKEKGCVFCTKSEPGDDRDNLVLFRGENSFVLMRRPIGRGFFLEVNCAVGEQNRV